MVTTNLRLHLRKGQKMSDAYEDVARHMWHYWRKREIKKLNGENKAKSKAFLSYEIIAPFLERKKYLYVSDVRNPDYRIVVENVFSTVMYKYLMKPDNYEDDELRKINTLFYPGLINQKGKGFFLSETNQEIGNYSKNRHNLLAEMGKSCDARTTKAYEHLGELLESDDTLKLKDAKEIA